MWRRLPRPAWFHSTRTWPELISAEVKQARRLWARVRLNARGLLDPDLDPDLQQMCTVSTPEVRVWLSKFSKQRSYGMPHAPPPRIITGSAQAQQTRPCSAAGRPGGALARPASPPAPPPRPTLPARPFTHQCPPSPF